MSLLPIAALAAAALAALLLLFPATRAAWQAVAAALLLGLAGYAAQGHPGLPGHPTVNPQAAAENGSAAVTQRQALAGRDSQGQSHLIIAEAMLRHGQYADAAEILRGAVEKNPNDGDAWLAMGNALVGHANGTLSPAALYAYRRASAADPAAPGPPFFLGLALAQSGRLQEGRELWAALLARAPADAPWKSDLERRLQMLDGFIANGAMPPRAQ